LKGSAYWSFLSEGVCYRFLVVFFFVSVRLVRFWSCISVERYKSCLFCFLCTLYNLHVSSRDSLTCHDVARIPYMCLCYNSYLSGHNTLPIPQPPFMNTIGIYHKRRRSYRSSDVFTSPDWFLWAGFNGAHFACKSVAIISGGVSVSRGGTRRASLVSSRLVLSSKLSVFWSCCSVPGIRGRTSCFSRSSVAFRLVSLQTPPQFNATPTIHTRLWNLAKRACCLSICLAISDALR
jgi:hypothetical protein